MGEIFTDRLQDLLDVGIALSAERDMERLLELILLEARRLTTADAATLYLVEGQKLRAVVAQCQTLIDRHGRADAHSLFHSFRIPLDNNSIAGACAARNEIINISDVQSSAPEMPFHYNPEFDKANNYSTHSNLAVPMRGRNGQVVGVLQLINAQNGARITPFGEEQIKIARALGSQAGVAICNAQLTDELLQAHLDTLQRIGVAAEWRDKETAHHIIRVSRYCRLIADHLGWSQTDADCLMHASPMHDVGKLGIPDAILHKAGSLTPEERAIMETHCEIGADILANPCNEVMEMGLIVAWGHHEKFDGSGYPRKQRGEEIHPGCRITAIADVFDALSTKRCYKPAFPDEKVRAILLDGAGSHFDPEMIEAFLSAWPEAAKIRDRYADTPETEESTKDATRLAMKAQEADSARQ